VELHDKIGNMKKLRYENGDAIPSVEDYFSE
jgi:hypothetical protein